ncbi:MAG TPA: hypothetical protein PLO36_05455 [Methanofastidiosum sp.]|nr:hypothetical protein [Methanofastidiosum sp.]HPA49562.1 hypothetical protein [Methanofastidiosum sp.]HQK62315.1 hypothetical protein [Methanofastidiosum sp.]HQM94728.1 hypothetical protein [Methanofastidiosum sp.]HQQ48466.1 hypothetical protein [Methanofastidiosum sp.]
MELEIGMKYQITKDGSSLSWIETNGVSEFQVVTRELNQGEIMIYLGRKDFPGCDVSYDQFQIDDKEGIFWPNQFGGAKKEFLRKVI